MKRIETARSFIWLTLFHYLRIHEGTLELLSEFYFFFFSSSFNFSFLSCFELEKAAWFDWLCIFMLCMVTRTRFMFTCYEQSCRTHFQYPGISLITVTTLSSVASGIQKWCFIIRRWRRAKLKCVANDLYILCVK